MWCDDLLLSDLVFKPFLLLLVGSLSTRDGYKSYSSLIVQCYDHREGGSTLAAAGFDGSCLPIFAATVEMTFCGDFGGVAGGGVGTGADYPMRTLSKHFKYYHHMNTLTSAVLLEAADWVVVTVVTLEALTVVDLLVDGVNLSSLTGVVVVTVTTDVLLVAVAIVMSGAIFFPFTEAAWA